LKLIDPLTMKVAGACLCIVGMSATICARGDDLPTKLNFERYKAMLAHSPFATGTAVVPAATPNFAKDLYVANAARSADGDMVTIASTSDKDFKKYLTTKIPADGYAIVSIQWSHKVGETKVTISKDAQLATLSFNQMVLAQPLPNRPPGVVSPPVPQQPVFQKSNILPNPTSHVRGVIQRYPQGQSPSPSAED
jgi:hypothetical protein